MADDIFLSPEEQDERAKKWLKDNGLAIVVGIGLGFGAIIGFNQYKESVKNDAEQASALFSTALTRVNDSNVLDIDAQVNTLKEQYGNTTYAAKSALLKATKLSDIDLSSAFDELQWVIDNAPEKGLVHTARLRQAKIKLSLGELNAAKELASHTPFDGFGSHYSEILGDIEAKLGNQDSASKHYQLAIDLLASSDVAYARILGFKLDRLVTTEAE